jgi:predicted dehydrogenase
LNPGWQQRLLNPAYGLGCLEAHIHDMDFINSVLGKPVRVSAQGRQTSQGAWVQVHSLLEYANGVNVGAEADYNVPLNFPLTMYLRVVGELGTLVFTFRGALAASQTARRSLILIKKGADPVELQVPITDAYGGMLAHFLDCATTYSQPQWGSPLQGRQALEILLAVSKSAACREIVAL